MVVKIAQTTGHGQSKLAPMVKYWHAVPRTFFSNYSARSKTKNAGNEEEYTDSFFLVNMFILNRFKLGCVLSVGILLETSSENTVVFTTSLLFLLKDNGNLQKAARNSAGTVL